MKFGGNAIVYGLLAATYPGFQLIGAPVLGRWSDTFGRKKVLLLSNVGTSVGWILFLFALFLPFEKSFSIDIAFLGTLVISVPLLVLFLPELLTALLVGIFLLQMLILRTFPQMEPGVKTLEKWRYLPTLGLF